MVQIAPSILSADFSCLTEELERIHNADLIHCDVMDGHFVPNITFGAKLVKDIRKVTNKPLDVHLMIETPEKYLDRFIDAGSDFIVIHAESTQKAEYCLDKIKDAGIKCGVAVSPDTPVDAFLPYIKKCDMALLMSVYPGFSGQKFIEGSVARLKQLKKMRDEINPSCLIEMDGGIGAANIGLLVQNGLQIAVAGNSVFGASCPSDEIDRLKAIKL